MRFRKSIKLLPGVKINLSNKGISTSVGPKGATVNVKPGRATRATIGLPGTGLSHTETIGSAPEQSRLTQSTREPIDQPAPIWVSILGTIWGALRFIVVGIIIAGAVVLSSAVFGGSKKR